MQILLKHVTVLLINLPLPVLSFLLCPLYMEHNCSLFIAGRFVYLGSTFSAEQHFSQVQCLFNDFPCFRFAKRIQLYADSNIGCFALESSWFYLFCFWPEKAFHKRRVQTVEFNFSFKFCLQCQEISFLQQTVLAVITWRWLLFCLFSILSTFAGLYFFNTRSTCAAVFIILLKLLNLSYWITAFFSSTFNMKLESWWGYILFNWGIDYDHFLWPITY